MSFNPFINGGGGGQGPAGKDGKGIESIVWLSSTGGNEPGIEGATDTYQINYTTGSPSTYEVTNGSKGSTGQTGA